MVIAEKCKTLTATDFASRMLQKAEKNCSGCKNITFRQGNILSLDFPDETFDKVVAGKMKFHFFQYYYPEVESVYPLKKYGFNIKSQLLKLLVIFPAAWICTLF